jgi:5-methylcytosine-specific restriction endonuclease McrA
MAIGKFVQSHIMSIVEICETSDPNLLSQLKNKEFSNKTFGLSFPFFTEIKAMDEKSHVRYWSTVYSVCNEQVRVCSQWYALHQARFDTFLEANNISESKHINGPSTQSKEVVNKRFKYRAIGNASNILVRNILSSLGNESFTKVDWQKTIEYFDHNCAYCGQKGDIEMDHIIPMNKSSLGEHKIGNIVPSCKPCNRKKHDKSYTDFLKGNPTATQRIESYMESRGYSPIHNKKVSEFVQLAYDEVATLAERYIDIINEKLENNSTE